MRSTIHELRNKLAIAVANIEAFIDGKIEPTPDRLTTVLEALYQVDVLIGKVRGGPAEGFPSADGNHEHSSVLHESVMPQL